MGVCGDGPTGIGIVKPGQGEVTVESVRFWKASDPTFLQEIDPSCSCDPNPNPKFTGVLSIVIPYRVSTRRDTTTTHRLPSLPDRERTDLRWVDDSVARQRVLVGNSFNDEEWGDDLSNPSSRQTPCSNTPVRPEKHEPESRQGWVGRYMQFWNPPPQ